MGPRGRRHGRGSKALGHGPGVHWAGRATGAAEAAKPHVTGVHGELSALVGGAHAAKIERLTNALPTEPFRWPQKFVRALSATDLGPDGPELCVKSGATASFYSEFSGSGAAEAALMAIVNASGRQLHVSQSHAADIDAGCRSVLHTACAGLSQFS